MEYYDKVDVDECERAELREQHADGSPQCDEPSAPVVPVVVKPWRPAANDAEVDAQTSVVEMSLLRDLRHRLDKRTLNVQELSELAPEMADASEDGKGCRPQCMVCLDELEEGQAVSRQSCGHTFHHECVATWLVSQLQNKQVGGCPHCKHPIVVPIIQRVDTPPEATPSHDFPVRETRSASRWGCFTAFSFRSATRRQVGTSGR